MIAINPRGINPQGMLMKSPIWILNSTLLIFYLIIIGIIFLVRQEIPSRKSLRPEIITTPIKKEVSKINLARIYENDLFNTLIKIAPPVLPVEETAVAVPRLPSLKPIPVPQKPVLQFLPPLPISLKGIIFSTNEQENRAIIANNKTKQEGLYKIGDKIEDADLIRIDRHKAILIRSNGQQETIFISQSDAQNDPIYTQETPWTFVVKKVSESLFIVDPKSFIRRVTSLAQFMDMLDVTTAFEHGISIGCRVGKMDPLSIGPALGLQPNDIITSINDKPTTTTRDRVAIYNEIKNLTRDATITVKLVRNGAEQTYSYSLEKIAKEEETQELALGSSILEQPRQADAASTEMLTQANHFNAPLQDIKKRDKSMMLRNGGRQTMLQRVPQ